MEMMVTGIKRVHGKSKEGNDFDMCALRVLVMVETGARKQIVVEGFGYEEAEIEAKRAVLAQCARLPFPCKCELATDQEFARGKFQTVVTGIKPVVAAAGNAASAASRTGTGG